MFDVVIKPETHRTIAAVIEVRMSALLRIAFITCVFLINC